LLRERRDFAGELQAEHDEGFEPVGFDDQKVMVAEPVIQAAESIAARLDLDAAIDAEQWHAYVAAEATARCAGQRHALGRKTVTLQNVNDGTLCAIPLLT
jgi:hypothetical protein